jgi:uncharacterized phage infection (PIP) family protein YhgE
MTTEIGSAGDQQRSLFTAVTSLERIVANGIQSDHGVTRQLTEAARALTEAADTSLAGAEAAAQAGRVATDAVRGIAEMSTALAASQMRVENAISEETESNARLADALRTSSNGVNATAKLLADIQTALGSLHGEFARIAEYSHEQSTAMSRLLTEQSAISSGLAQVAREISANSGGAGNANSGETTALIRRLDALTNALSRASSTAPQPVEQPAPAPQPTASRSMLPNAPDLFTDPLETPAANRARGLWPRRDER